MLQLCIGNVWSIEWAFGLHELYRWHLLYHDGGVIFKCVCKLRRGHLCIFFRLDCLCKLFIGHLLGDHWWQQL